MTVAGEEPATAHSNVFVFSTANGVITDWYISLDLQDGVQMTSSGGGDYDFGPTYTATCYQDQTCQTVIASNLTLGSWGGESLQSQLDEAVAAVTALQKQLAHVTAQMKNVNKAATIEYEAEIEDFNPLDLQQQAIIAACRAHKPC